MPLLCMKNSMNFHHPGTHNVMTLVSSPNRRPAPLKHIIQQIMNIPNPTSNFHEDAAQCWMAMSRFSNLAYLQVPYQTRISCEFCNITNSQPLQTTGLFPTNIKTYRDSLSNLCYNGNEQIKRIFNESEEVDARCLLCHNKKSIGTFLLVAPEFLAVQFKLFDNNLNKIQARSNHYSSVCIATDNGNSLYTVVATIQHIGETIRSGHYVAYIKKNDTWFRCDDERITVSRDHKAVKNAYIVILQKIPIDNV